MAIALPIIRPVRAPVGGTVGGSEVGGAVVGADQRERAAVRALAPRACLAGRVLLSERQLCGPRPVERWRDKCRPVER